MGLKDQRSSPHTKIFLLIRSRWCGYFSINTAFSEECFPSPFTGSSPGNQALQQFKTSPTLTQNRKKRTKMHNKEMQKQTLVQEQSLEASKIWGPIISKGILQRVLLFISLDVGNLCFPCGPAGSFKRFKTHTVLPRCTMGTLTEV